MNFLGYAACACYAATCSKSPNESWTETRPRQYHEEFIVFIAFQRLD